MPPNEEPINKSTPYTHMSMSMSEALHHGLGPDTPHPNPNAANSGGTLALMLGTGLLVMLPLASYVLRSTHASKAQQQQKREEAAATASKHQEALEGMRAHMRQWYQAYEAAVQERDALAAKLQDPEEELKNLFNDQALQDPNNPAPNPRADLKARYEAAVARASSLHAQGETLKRDYDAMGNDGKPKAD